MLQEQEPATWPGAAQGADPTPVGAHPEPGTVLGSSVQEGCGLWESREGRDGDEGLGHVALGQLGLLGWGKAEGALSV